MTRGSIRRVSNDMDRRGFLKSLGIGLGSVIVAQSLPPAHYFFEPVAGPVTPEWITAEALRLLKRNLSGARFKIDDDPRLYPSMSWHGVDFDSGDDHHKSQHDFSRIYLEPVAAMLGNQIAHDNPKSFMKLRLPMQGTEFTQLATDEECGLSLRFIRAHDVLGVDETGIPRIRLISRFDLAYSP